MSEPADSNKPPLKAAARTTSTPGYITEVASRARPDDILIGAHEEGGATASSAPAPRARAATPRSQLRVTEPTGPTAAAANALSSPYALIVVPIVLMTLVVGGLSLVGTRAVSAAETDTVAAEDAYVDALDREAPAMLTLLDTAGANTTVLRAYQQAMTEAPTRDARLESADQLLLTLTTEQARGEMDRESGAQLFEMRSTLTRLSAAQTTADEQRARWIAATDTASGRVAIMAGLARGPRD
jgi:hypothetical protein